MGASYDIIAGSVSQMVEVTIRDSTTGQGKTGIAHGDVTARYIRQGSSAGVAITMAAGTLGTWSSGGWVVVDATNSPGRYQFGIPDAALVAGAGAVKLTFKISGAIDKDVEIKIDDGATAELQRELIGSAAGRVGGWSNRSTAVPRSFNCEIFAPLRFGDFNCLLLSDSTGSMVVQHRARYGFMRAFLDGLPFRRFYIPPICSAPTEGYQTFNRPSTTIAPGAAIGDGSSTNDSALQMGVVAFSANEATTLHQTWLKNLSQYGASLPMPARAVGDPTRNQRMKASLLYRKTAAGTNLTALQAIARRTGTSDVTTVLDLSAAAAGTSEIDIPMNVPSATAQDDHGIIYSTGAEDETGKFFAYNGHVFYTDATSGLSLTSISEGGWKTDHHLSPLNSGADAAYYHASGVYTQAQAAVAATQAGWPGIIIIALGLNLGAAQTSQDAAAKADFKAHLKLIMARWSAVYAAAAKPAPLFYLVAPHQSADGASNRRWAGLRAEACYECATEDMSHAAFGNIHGYTLERFGDYTVWQSTYLGDTVHWNAAGEILRWTILGQYIREATAPTHAALVAARESRRLAIDPVTPGETVVGSFADQILNADANRTYSKATDSLEAISLAAAAVKAKTDQITSFDFIAAGTRIIAAMNGSGVYSAEALANAPTGGGGDVWNEAQRDAVLTALQNNPIQRRSPIDDEGNVVIYAGDAYSQDLGNALTWTIVGFAGDEPTAAILRFLPLSSYRAGTTDGAVEFDASVDLDDGDLTITAELSAAESATIEPSVPPRAGNYRAQVRVQSEGEWQTLVDVAATARRVIAVA